MCSRPARAVATLTAAGLGMLMGCSSGPGEEPQPSPPTGPTATTTVGTHPPAPGAVEVSPGGVTTAVGAPAESMEEEYFRACHAAKVWMDQQGGDRKALIESYLATVQAPGAPPGPATFDTQWAQLSPTRQSAVIVAVGAAADALCG